jgi:hypothetical protein
MGLRAGEFGMQTETSLIANAAAIDKFPSGMESCHRSD